MAVIRTRLLLFVVIAGILAACGTGTPSSGTASAPVTATGPASEAPGSPGEPSASPVDSEPPAGTDQPSESGPPAETEQPAGSEPAPASVAPTATPSDGGGPAVAAECSGNTGNLEFFAGFARAVSWSSLCAVLPKGWFVSQGTYRLANGGKLLIGYKGPAGATIALSEGSFCADASGCVPSGAEIGAAALGPFTGTMSRLDDGGYAIVAARGENPSWLFVTHGLNETVSRALGAALAVVPR